MDTPANALLRKLRDDIAPTGLPFHVDVFDVARRQWISGVAAPFPPEGFDSGFVVSLPGRENAVEAMASGMPDLVAITDAVSDWMMDELGRGWPELADAEGRFIALLTPEATEGGVTWVGGGHRVPVGELNTVRLVSARIE